MAKLTMSVGRDYRMTGRYEYAIFNGEDLAAKAGFFRSYAAAKRAGIAKAAEIVAADPQLSLAV